MFQAKCSFQDLNFFLHYRYFPIQHYVNRSSFLCSSNNNFQLVKNNSTSRIWIRVRYFKLLTHIAGVFSNFSYVKHLEFSAVFKIKIYFYTTNNFNWRSHELLNFLNRSFERQFSKRHWHVIDMDINKFYYYFFFRSLIRIVDAFNIVISSVSS